MNLSHLLSALLTILVYGPCVYSSVIGIDYGTDWFKVSIVKTGVPLDLVLNVESKRKTPAVVHIKNRVRLFESDATSKGIRFPQDTYPALKNLLGKSFDSDIAQDYRSTFTNQMMADSKRGTCSFAENATTLYTVEELVGFQLAHAKKQAELFGGEPVSGAVLTIPPNFNHFERQAILDAAQIAGLRILNLMNDETAVALNYAMLRKFDSTQHHIFYDMGAGSTVASLVTFGNVIQKKSGTNYTVPQLQVKAVGFDSTLGGKAIDLRLQNIFIDSFVSKTKGKITKDQVMKSSKAMAKLLREANRVKQILSANTETFASVEGVFEDYDFRMKISRQELEDVCQDLVQRVKGPIESVLNEAQLTIADIDSVVLVGGGVRVPMVQSVLRDFVGSDKIAQNVNGDEAAVLGAGFRAATLSKLFRVREILVKDKNLDFVEIIYESEPESGDKTSVKATIFTNKVSLGAKKIMNFKRTSDFDFTVAYKNTSTPILSVAVKGVAEAFEKIKSKGTVKEIKVKAVLSVSENGVFGVQEVYMQAEVSKGTVESLKDSVMSFFGKKKENEDEQTDGDAEEGYTEGASKNATESEQAKNDTEKAQAEEPKIINEKVKLDFVVTPLTILPLEKAQFDEIKEKIRIMDADDYKRKQRDEARNNLESFVYIVRDLMESSTTELVSTAEDRQGLKQVLDSVRDWLEEQGDSAPADDILLKDKSIRDIWEPIDLRRTEKTKRPEAIESLQKSIKEAQSFLKDVGIKNAALMRDIAAAEAEQAKKDAEEEAKRKEEEAKKQQEEEKAAENASSSDKAPESVEENSEEKAEGDSTTSTESEKPTPTIPTKPKRKPTPTMSPEDLESVEKTVTDYAEWLNKKLTEQSKLKDTESPIVLSDDIITKRKLIDNEVARLSIQSKKVFKTKKAKPTTKSTTTMTTTTSTAAQETTSVASTETNAPSHDEL